MFFSTLIIKQAVKYVHTSATTREALAEVIQDAAGALLLARQQQQQQQQQQNGGGNEGGDVESGSTPPAVQSDVNTAITFVVAPHFAPDDFVEFSDFCIWLDEEFLADAPPPERWVDNLELEDEEREYYKDDERGDDDDDDDDEDDHEDELEEWTLGDLVIAAGFHPLWEFGGEEATGGAGSPVHWEKRSPSPVVSLVHADAIEGAAAATAKIADHNREVLLGLGADEVRRRYLRDVLGGGSD